MNSIVTGHTEYMGYTAQQHKDVFKVFELFLEEIKPSRILEFGTAGGGFTLFLRHTLDKLGLNNTKIKSFDVHESSWYNTLRENNIEIIIDNIFDHSYFNLIKTDMVVPFIQEDGVTLVLCDGGHKRGEFNIFGEIIKKGDFIMAHDYIDTYDNFKLNYEHKIWDWCELEEKYISEVSEKENLVSYNKTEFDKVVWVCKTKK